MSTPPDPAATARPSPSARAPVAEPVRVPLESVVAALPYGAVVLDVEGRVACANAEAAALLAEEGADPGGQDFFRGGPSALRQSDAERRFREEVGSGELRFNVQIAAPHAEGDQELRIHFRSLPGPGGPWTLAVLEPITDAQRERERRERAERLAAVGELAAGVAHEVNNPLASIKSFAQLLARDATSREQREALDLIINESSRVAEIVANLLSFARRQGAGGREPVSLSAIAERVLQVQRYALETAGIEVRRDFDASLSPVMGEVGALQQVVLNMVVNAEQALATKDGDRLLIVRTRESTEGVILAVVDNGPGIPRELLPHIFERFRTTKPGGTGLGLAISAAIVRDHAGQIWAESDKGRGTAFNVLLPRAPTDSLPPPEAAVKEQPRAVAPVRPLRVLVADDEAALRLAIALFLNRRGHTVVQAADAFEALRYAQEQTFDVALVDARMPGDGLALLEQLESIPSLRGRTALMTGDLGRSRTRQGIATGRPYLTKPFDMDEMVALLESLGG